MNQSPVEIRPESTDDVEAITRITEAAFRTVPHSDHREQWIVLALRDAGALSLSLVAEEDGTVVGHIAFSPVTLSDGPPGWFGLGPVSVLPDHQHRGIGSALIRAGLTMLRTRGAAGCVVLGEPAYYGRFGFRAEPGCVLEGVPPEYFQAQPFVGDAPAATVTYHKAFNA